MTAETSYRIACLPGECACAKQGTPGYIGGVIGDCLCRRMHRPRFEHDGHAHVLVESGDPFPEGALECACGSTPACGKPLDGPER